MNNRIKELACMCGATPSKDFGVQVMRGERFDIEKFAELIVRECAEISFEHWMKHKECSAHFSIREHFGVE